MGLVCTAAPFALVSLFGDKRRGILWVALGILSLHALVGIGSQALGVFSYPVVATVHVLASLGALAYALSRGAVRGWSFSREGLIVLWAVAIIVFQLALVHYDYSGPVASIKGESIDRGVNYPYPLFSDEWVASSLISHTVKTGSLPLANSLWEGERSVNLLVPFHSLASEVSLFFGLDPVVGVPVLAIVFGALVSVSAMFLAWSMGGGVLASVLAGVFVPLITNGSNLPGIWFLMPFVVSLSPFLWFLSALSVGRRGLAVGCGSVSVLLYPPMLVFVLPAGLASAWGSGNAFLRRTFLICGAAVLAVASAAGLSVLLGPGDFWARVSSAVFHGNLDGGVASYSFWKVLPGALAPFFVLGFFRAWGRESRHVVAAVIVGAFAWVAYSVLPVVFLIEHPRVVVITAVLLSVFAAFGFSAVLDGLLGTRLRLVSCVVALALASSVSFLYPWGDSWRDLTLSVRAGGDVVTVRPAAPVNRYLHPDDLRLFEGVTGSRFIAPPWKGLVIGAATGNYPLESKASTITNRYVLYADFMSSGCDAKASIAQEWKVSVVYSEPFDCNGFRSTATSSEGLVFYRVRGF